jgi:putative transcriptional regulator
LNADGHPSTTVLAQYAAGALPLAPALVVNAHLGQCATCRGRVGDLEEAEGRLLASLPNAALADDAFEQVLARLPTRPQPLRLTRRAIGDVPLPVAVARAGLSPRRYLTPEFWVAPVRASRADGWRAYVLRAPAGWKIPRHLHRGPEFISVLMGAFQDGRRHAAGDFAENLTNHEHELQVTAEGPCACLIAARGGARWRGLAGAITPLLGV